MMDLRTVWRDQLWLPLKKEAIARVSVAYLLRERIDEELPEKSVLPR